MPIGIVKFLNPQNFFNKRHLSFHRFCFVYNSTGYFNTDLRTANWSFIPTHVDYHLLFYSKWAGSCSDQLP